jgi:serine/threonine-protein kinase SRPK3
VLNQWSLRNVLIEKYHLKIDEADELASFMEPMLNPYPEKRANAREALSHSWLEIKDSECYSGRMNDEELRAW